jgi:hypothetical protein
LAAAPKALPLEGVSTDFETLLGDLMALLQGVGQSAAHAPPTEAPDAAPRRVESDPDAADEAAVAEAPENEPEPEEPDESVEVDPETAVAAESRAAQAPPDPSGAPARPEGSVVRSAPESAIDASVEPDRGGAFGRAPEAPPAAEEAPAPAGPAPIRPGALVADPAWDASGPEAEAPAPAPPRDASEAALPPEASVLFEADGSESGADPSVGRRVYGSPAGPSLAEALPPAPPAVAEPPPASSPAVEAAPAAVPRAVPESSNVFAALEKALGIAVEEVSLPDAGVSADAGGGSSSNPATLPTPAPVAAPVAAAAASGPAPSGGDPAAARLDVGTARRAGAADPTAPRAPAAPPKSSAADRAEVVERIVRAAKLARQQGEAHIKIVLRPPELGRLRVDLSVRDHVLTARLSADRSGAAELVQSNLGALRDALEQQGVRVGELSVSVDGDAPGSSPRHSADGRASAFEDASGFPAGSFGEETELPAARRPAPRGLALVDLFA